VTIEKKMNKGQLMEFPATTAENGPATIGDSRKFTNTEKTKFGNPDFKASRIRNIDTAHVAKTKRNYVWLRYKIGEVSNELMGGLDVLSGKFSGCYMIKYQIPGQAWRVGHVDTGPEGGEAGVAAWNKMVVDENPEIACGFKPFQAEFADDFGITTCTYGIITADKHRCYSIVTNNSAVWNFEDSHDTNIRLIRKVTKRKTIPVADLRVLRLMNA